jgi:hypothetical protein
MGASIREVWRVGQRATLMRAWQRGCRIFRYHRATSMSLARPASGARGAALGAAATLLGLAQSAADTAWLWAGADAFADPRLGSDVGLVSPGYRRDPAAAAQDDALNPDQPPFRRDGPHERNLELEGRLAQTYSENKELYGSDRFKGNPIA